MDDVQNMPDGAESEDAEAQISETAPEDENNEDVNAAGQESEAEASEDSQEDAGTPVNLSQKELNDIFARKRYDTNAANERAEAAERRAEAAEAKLPTPKAPVIPPMPDPDLAISDPAKYKEDMDARDQALADGVRFDARLEVQEEEQARQAKEQRTLIVEKQIKVHNDYATNSKSFGIDEKQMQNDAAIVADTLGPSDVQAFISQDEHGPLITNHLATHPLELDKITGMTSVRAGIYITNEIKPKLAGAVKQTLAPAPADIVGGKGAPDNKRGPKGAVYT